VEWELAEETKYSEKACPSTTLPPQIPHDLTWARTRVWSSGICDGQSGAGAGFLRVLRFPLSIIIITRAGTMDHSVAYVPSGPSLDSTPHYANLKNKTPELWHGLLRMCLHFQGGIDEKTAWFRHGFYFFPTDVALRTSLGTHVFLAKTIFMSIYILVHFIGNFLSRIVCIPTHLLWSTFFWRCTYTSALETMSLNGLRGNQSL
jgi:hypothetical protein